MRLHAEIVPGAAHDGAGNALLKHDGFEWIVRDDSAVQLHPGETLSVWTAFAGAADGRAYSPVDEDPDELLEFILNERRARRRLGFRL
jgi:hypothetical protein